MMLLWQKQVKKAMAPPLFDRGLGSENGEFQPSRMLAETVSNIPIVLAELGTLQTTNPVSFQYKVTKDRMQSCSLGFPGISEPRCRQVGSGRRNWLKRPFCATSEGRRLGPSP